MPLLVAPTVTPGSLASTEQPVLDAGSDLLLRPWRETDAPVLRAAYDDAAIQRWHVRRFDSDDEARAYIASLRERWTAEAGATWAVVDSRTDAVFGRVAVGHLDLYDGGAEVGYWTLPAARGRGVAVAAARAVAAWAFGVGFHRLQLEHSTANAASCRAASRAGFTPVYTRHSAALHSDGWHDMHVHALVADS